MDHEADGTVNNEDALDCILNNEDMQEDGGGDMFWADDDPSSQEDTVREATALPSDQLNEHPVVPSAPPSHLVARPHVSDVAPHHIAEVPPRQIAEVTPHHITEVSPHHIAEGRAGPRPYALVPDARFAEGQAAAYAATPQPHHAPLAVAAPYTGDSAATKLESTTPPTISMPLDLLLPPTLPTTTLSLCVTSQPQDCDQTGLKHPVHVLVTGGEGYPALFCRVSLFLCRSVNDSDVTHFLAPNDVQSKFQGGVLQTVQRDPASSALFAAYTDLKVKLTTSGMRKLIPPALQPRELHYCLGFQLYADTTQTAPLLVSPLYSQCFIVNDRSTRWRHKDGPAKKKQNTQMQPPAAPTGVEASDVHIITVSPVNSDQSHSVGVLSQHSSPSLPSPPPDKRQNVDSSDTESAKRRRSAEPSLTTNFLSILDQLVVAGAEVCSPLSDGGGQAGIVSDDMLFKKRVDICGKLTAKGGLLVTSDERVKNFFGDVSGADCCKLLKLVLQEYSWTDEYATEHGISQQLKAGFRAQELEALLPQLVEHTTETVGGQVIEDFRRVKWDELLVYVIGAMQVHESQFNELHHKHKPIEKVLTQSVDRLCDLESRVQQLEEEIETLDKRFSPEKPAKKASCWTRKTTLLALSLFVLLAVVLAIVVWQVTTNLTPPPPPPCSLACSGHGVCSNYECVCSAGYLGLACELVNDASRYCLSSTTIACLPKVEFLGLGMDAVSGKLLAPVSTVSFAAGTPSIFALDGDSTRYHVPTEVFATSLDPRGEKSSVKTFVDSDSYINHWLTTYIAALSNTSSAVFSQSSLAPHRSVFPNKNVVSIHQSVELYSAQLRFFGDADANFLRYIDSLPTDYGTGYEHLVQFFGTHVVTRAYFGGRLEFEVPFSHCEDIKSVERTALDVWASFFGNRPQKIVRGVDVRDSLRVIGGNKEAFFNCTECSPFDAWADTIRSNPEILRYDVVELPSLVENKDKRKHLEHAIEAHFLAAVPRSSPVPLTPCVTPPPTSLRPGAPNGFPGNADSGGSALGPAAPEYHSAGASSRAPSLLLLCVLAIFLGVGC